MKYIDKILNGREVVWRPLGEVAELYAGLRGKNKNDFENGNSLYVSYKNVFDNIEVDPNRLEKVFIDANENQNCVLYGDVLFTNSSETLNEVGMSCVVTCNFTEKVYLNSFCFGLRFHKDINILPEFAKFLFRVPYIRKEISRASSGVTRYNLSKERFKKILIPIPPRDVQEEIVEVLDKFTELERELERELELRLKQYEYYRNKLLTFDDDKVQWRPLGEVCETVTDFTAAGSFANNAKNVKYKQNEDFALLVRTTDLKSKFKDNGKLIFVDEHAYNYLWRVQLNKDFIILPNVGNCGEVYFINPQMLPYENCVLGPNAILLRSDIIINKYLYYWFTERDFQTKLRKITSTTGQTKFNKTNLKTLLIPIPARDEQERIVEILDKFDKLVNSLSEGLPREIELRRKQYEYYRNELLCFARSEL